MNKINFTFEFKGEPRVRWEYPVVAVRIISGKLYIEFESERAVEKFLEQITYYEQSELFTPVPVHFPNLSIELAELDNVGIYPLHD